VQLKAVHTAPWPHCPNKNVFRNRLIWSYDKPHSLRLGARLEHNALPHRKPVQLAEHRRDGDWVSILNGTSAQKLFSAIQGLYYFISSHDRPSSDAASVHRRQELDECRKCLSMHAAPVPEYWNKRGHGQFLGAHGERVEREPITGVWGRAPSGLQGQSPWSGGQGGGASPPLKLKAF